MQEGLGQVYKLAMPGVQPLWPDTLPQKTRKSSLY